MQLKPDAKPVVLGCQNPLQNGGLTIKKKKKKQNKAGFGSSNQNQNPPYLLVSQPYKQGSFSCFFSLRSCFVRLIRAQEKRLSTGFQQSFQQWHEMGVTA